MTTTINAPQALANVPNPATEPTVELTAEQWDRHRIKDVHRTMRSLLGMYPAADWSLEESTVVHAALAEIALWRQRGVRGVQLEKAAADIAARDRMRALVLAKTEARLAGIPQCDLCDEDESWSSPTDTRLPATTERQRTWTSCDRNRPVILLGGGSNYSVLDLSSKGSRQCSTSVSLVLTSITMSLILMFGGSSRYFARRSGSLMADFLGAVVRGILCLAHVRATSSRLPVLLPATAPGHRLLRVPGELVQTTAAEVDHPRAYAMH
jgi:hypothetical protein